MSRPDGPVSHIVQALGTSSTAKGATFTEQTYAQANEAPRPRIYTNYEDVYNDPDVDVVYVGVPHSMHKDICLQAIAKNKHVLCEKPIAMNEQDAREMVEAARKKGVYLMEGMIYSTSAMSMPMLNNWFRRLDTVHANCTRSATYGA